MNNEAIAAHLSAICLVVIGGAHQPIFLLSILNSWSLVPVEQRKRETNSSIYPRNGLDLLNEILETGQEGMSRSDAGKPRQSVPINLKSGSSERIVFWNLIVEGVEKAEKRIGEFYIAISLIKNCVINWTNSPLSGRQFPCYYSFCSPCYASNRESL